MIENLREEINQDQSRIREHTDSRGLAFDLHPQGRRREFTIQSEFSVHHRDS